MKTWVLFLLATMALTAAPLEAAPIPKISTLTGRVYRQCKIVRVHPDGVSFTHANGAAKVLFMDLPESWRGRLGYNPAKAAAYEREQAERRAQAAEARQARQQELAKAMAVAREMELTRAFLAEQQAQAAMRAAANNHFAYAQSVPVLPALGAVFDSRDYRYRARYSDWYGNGFYYPGGYGYRFPHGGYYGGIGFHHGGSYCAPRHSFHGTRGVSTITIRK